MNKNATHTTVEASYAQPQPSFSPASSLAFEEGAAHAPAIFPAANPGLPQHDPIVAAEAMAAIVSPDLQTQPELAATIFNALGRAYLNRGHLQLGRQYIDRGLQIRQKFYGDEHPAVADSLQMQARIHRDAGMLDEAEVAIRRALGIHSRVAKGTVAVAATLWELAVIQLEKNELAAAERSALEGLDILEKLYLEHSDPHVPRLQDILARIHSYRGEHSRAAEIYASVLDRVAKKVGKKVPKYAAYLANLGTVEQARGNLHEAEACYREAIDVYEGVNAWHPNLSGFYVNLARLMRSKGADFFAEARKYYRKSMDLNERTWGRDHSHFGYDQLSLGILEFECGNLPEAYRLIEDALRVFRLHSSSSSHAASALTILARICLESYEPDRPTVHAPPVTQAPLKTAEDALTEAIPFWRKELGESSVEHMTALAALGRTWFLLGDRARAAKSLRESYPVIMQVRGAASKIAIQVRRWVDEAGSTAPAPEKLAAVIQP